MKKNFILNTLILGLCFTEILAQTPTTGKNAVMEKTPREAMTTLSGATHTTVQTAIQYFDGLGKPTQTVIYKGSPDATKDILSSTTQYDALGRAYKSILPTPSDGATGAYQATAQTLATSFYDNDANPFTETIFEASPLNRPKQQFGAGQAWRLGAGHSVGMEYLTAGTEILHFEIRASGTIEKVGTYVANSLICNRTISERDFKTNEYKDRLGRVVAKSQELTEGNFAITLYIYDDLNRLRIVIPPEAYQTVSTMSSFTESSPVFLDGMFNYVYDARGRLAEKHIPGGGTVRYVYDKNDRVVLENDDRDAGITPTTANYYKFYKYDLLGRVVQTGLIFGIGTFSRSQLQTDFDNHAALTYEERGTDLLGYTNRSFPGGYTPIESSLRTVTYYDDYTWQTDTTYNFKSAYAYHAQANAKGMITGTLVRNLETNDWYKFVNYFDYQGHNIQTHAQNHVGGIDRTDYQYRFNGEVLKMRMTHRKTGANDLVELYEYSYDHLGRKVSYTHNNQVVCRNEYDAIGRLQSKKFRPSGTFQSSKQTGNWTDANSWLSGVFPLANDNVTINTGHTLTIPSGQIASAGVLNNNGILKNFGTLNMGKVPNADLYLETFHHHIRGGLRGLNLDNFGNLTNSLFSMKLGYEEGLSGYFDGNIASQTWLSAIDNVSRTYTYSYDGASRILGASFTGGKPNENYSLDNLSYDLNGNLKTLNRKGKTGTNSWGDIDQLNYVYQANSNKIQAVNDALLVNNPNVGDFRDSSSITIQYAYNQDGSLNSDDNKKISFEWNYLKRPKKITKANGQWEKFIYDAEGKLLQTQTSTGITTDFVGNKTYQNGILYQISHDEGRIINGNYEYDINDHAGNLRVSFKDSLGIAKIVTKLDYDPWGLRLKGLDYYNSGTYNKFKTFSGKQLHDDFGFNLLSYKFRYYDPALGKFISIDPLAEEYSNNSTFAFAENKLGLGVEYEGLELAPFPIFGKAPPVMIEPAISRPVIEPVTRLAPIENVTKLGEVNSLKAPKTRYSPETLEKFAEGRKVEVEQLAKSGQDKNTTPYKAIDPKTGKEGTTIPDAMRPNGGTTEVKFVKNQPLDKQLRLQNEVSKAAGVKPELIINQSAKITKPVRDLFDIKTYTAPPVSSDATRVAPTIKVQGTNPCKDNPNCL